MTYHHLDSAGFSSALDLQISVQTITCLCGSVGSAPPWSEPWTGPGTGPETARDPPHLHCPGVLHLECAGCLLPFTHLWIALKGSIKKWAEGAFANLLCPDAVKDRIHKEWAEDVGVAHHSVKDEGTSFPKLCRTDKTSIDAAECSVEGSQVMVGWTHGRWVSGGRGLSAISPSRDMAKTPGRRGSR